MANTVSILSFANTFGDWVVVTNALARENNDFAANNFVKPAGTLFLNSPTLGLQVANGAIVAGALQVQGIGSSAFIQNNLQVDRQVYFTNTSLSLVASGQTNVAGPLFATASGTGLAVSNNATVGGTLGVSRATTLSGTLAVSGATTVQNTVGISGTTSIANNLFVSGNTTVSKDLSANNAYISFGIEADTLNVTTSSTVQGNSYVSFATFSPRIQANTFVNTAILTVTGSGTVNTLQANTSINTQSIFASSIQANSSVNAASIIVAGPLTAQTIVSNTTIDTVNLNARGTVWVNVLNANAFVYTDSVVSLNGIVGDSLTANTAQINNSINTASISVTGNTITNRLQATGNVLASHLNANNSVTTPTLWVTSALDASGVPISYFSGVAAGSLSVSGNFTINGATVYNTNTFTLSANTNNQTSTLAVYRTANGAINGAFANAEIRWSESSKQWQLRDVDNITSYSRILTANLISDSITSTNSSIIASAAAANNLNNLIQSANTFLQANDRTVLTTAQTLTNTANTFLQANDRTTLTSAETFTNTANTFLQANDATTLTNARNYTDTANTFLQANDRTTLTSAQSYTDTANTIQTNRSTAINTFAAGAFSRANTSANSFTGTSSYAEPSSGSITFTSTNGVTIVGSGSTLTVNTPQSVRTNASPTFAGLSLTNALALTQGGTGATSASSALTNLLPTGTTAGYVLTTGGPGNFYWSDAGGGGSGATPGTTINSTRLNYVASNGTQQVWSTPTFSAATQVRAYINGVRQSESEYTLNQANSRISFGTAPSTSDVILIEVDGFIDNPYFANNITFTAPFGSIAASANTIQLAIQDLESRKATLASPIFTGVPTAPTMPVFASNTTIATTSFVKTLLNNGNTFTLIAKNISDFSINQSVGTANNVQFNSLGVGTAASGTAGEIRATNQVSSYYSDDRLKTRIGGIENALEKVKQLTGFYYEANQTAQDLGYAVKREVGLSAQDVQKQVPEVVGPAPIDEKYLTIQYERLVPLLVEAIKELEQQVAEIKGKM